MSSSTVTKKTAGRVMNEFLSGKSFRGHELTKDQLQNKRDTLAEYANGLRPASKAAALAKIAARSNELGLGELVQQSKEIVADCDQQDILLSSAMTLIQEAAARNKKQKGQAEDMETNAVTLAAQQQYLGQKTVSAAEMSCVAHKRCRNKVKEIKTKLRDERKRRREESETAEELIQWYKNALSHRITMTEQLEKVMGEQDTLLKERNAQGQSLEAMASEIVDEELAALYNKVGTLEAELAEKAELLSASEQKQVERLMKSPDIVALQDELASKNDIIRLYAVGHPETPTEEFRSACSRASSSNQRTPEAPEVGSAHESISPTYIPFGLDVDWGGSSVESTKGANSVGLPNADTLSVDSSERYNWFDNDGLSSCTHNTEGNDEDGDSDINVTYF